MSGRIFHDPDRDEAGLRNQAEGMIEDFSARPSELYEAPLEEKEWLDFCKWIFDEETDKERNMK